jgi:nicotinate-nucleotide pyrophosphorylase (carboxylating)
MGDIQMDFLVTDGIISNALKEDIGTGDITTTLTVPEGKKARARIIMKENGVICGTVIAKRVFEFLDKDIVFRILKNDGEKVYKGETIAEIEGNARNILTGERTALNFLQHLSGIATSAAKAKAAVSGTNTKICDTRKTVPGLRVFEKYAVLKGGCFNHRFNLSDGILIKNNHIKAAGGIKQAVESVRKAAPHTLRIEVECENITMVQEALESKADIIMLDNMTLEAMREAVRLINKRAVTEASGNMGEKDLSAVAATGVDYISIGAITHSAPALDISLKFE